MLFKNWSICILAFVCSFALAQEAAPEQELKFDSAIVPEGTAVNKLTLDNFAKFIKANDLVLGEFTVPWCLHSKNLLPELVKAAEILDSEKGIKVFQVDCSIDEALCNQLEIPYYPSLKVFKNHRLIKDNEYTGRRTAEDMYDFMVNQVASPVKRISTEEQLNEFYVNHEKMTGPVVVYYGKLDNFDKVFDKAANDLFNSFTFVAYPNCNETMKDNVILYLPPVPEMELQHNNHTIRTGTDIFKFENTTSTDPKDFKTWLLYSKLPYFDNANIENYRSYMDSKLPLAYYFYLTPQEYMDYKEFFGDLGEKYRGKVNFLGLNALIFHSHVRFLNMKEQFPLFAIHDLNYNLKYGLPQLSEEEYNALTELQTLDREEITQLVDDFVNGKAQPIVKSEEVPTVQHSNVTKIVGSNHDEMVHNESKDVIVRYHASWDAQSKKLEPIYYDIADMFARDEETRDKIVFLDVDAAANDIISFPVTGFPTIVIYPAGSHDKPIVHVGARVRSNILLFIKENGKHQLDGFNLVEKYQLDVPAEKAVDKVIFDPEHDTEKVNHDEL